MLAAADIHMTLGRTQVLHGVSIGVGRGEMLALIGPNGAGKSTLLHVLSGALAPRRGEVALDGQALRRWPRTALARRRAVLAQTPVHSFPFRVWEFVTLGRSPHRGYATRSDDLRVVRAALAETDALHLAERTYTTLSGGERQRVRLAQALAQIWPERPPLETTADTRYVLFDEPTNNLDLSHQHVFMRTARRLTELGCGVLAVLHEPNLAAIYADRICVLADGRLVAEGPPKSVMTASLFERIFDVRVHMLSHPERGRPVVLPV